MRIGVVRWPLIRWYWPRAQEARHAQSQPHVPVTQRVIRPVSKRAGSIGSVVAHARRIGSSACVRQAQLIGTARRSRSTTFADAAVRLQAIS